MTIHTLHVALQFYVGDQLLDARDVSQLTMRRPFDRGYLVNWELQSEILGRALRALLRANPSECGLVMTEPLFNFPQIEGTTEQVRLWHALHWCGEVIWRFASGSCCWHFVGRCGRITREWDDGAWLSVLQVNKPTILL